MLDWSVEAGEQHRVDDQQAKRIVRVPEALDDLARREPVARVDLRAVLADLERRLDAVESLPHRCRPPTTKGITIPLGIARHHYGVLVGLKVLGELLRVDRARLAVDGDELRLESGWCDFVPQHLEDVGGDRRDARRRLGDHLLARRVTARRFPLVVVKLK